MATLRKPTVPTAEAVDRFCGHFDDLFCPLGRAHRRAALPHGVAAAAGRPVVMQITLADPLPFGSAAAFREIFALSHDDRPARYRDAQWRNRAREDFAQVYPGRFERLSVQETAVHGDIVDRPLADVARERNADPLDLMCDLALAEDLKTRFRFVVRKRRRETARAAPPA